MKSIDDVDQLGGLSRVVRVVSLMFFCFILWAYYFSLDEVSTGPGKVVPSSKHQIIQSLEGGVLRKLLVKEGDVVERGQVLAQLDRTLAESIVDESESKIVSALASSARLRAEVEGAVLEFPEEIQDQFDLLNAERALYDSRRKNIEQKETSLRDSMDLTRQELDMLVPLVEKGAASNVEVLRLRRQHNELALKLDETRAQYLVAAREQLADVNTEIESLRAIIKGREDTLERLTLRSPVKGVVKEIEINTVGGVVPPNGRLMEIVPIDEHLQIEARIRPRDIAYIYPGQDANVKITAYDYSVYGGLTGKVVLISPDTIQDEVNRDQYYYRVYIRTDSDVLSSASNEDKSILPGMVATVDIKSGSKTVLSYLLKPFNKAREAMRER